VLGAMSRNRHVGGLRFRIRRCGEEGDAVAVRCSGDCRPMEQVGEKQDFESALTRHALRHEDFMLRVSRPVEAAQEGAWSHTTSSPSLRLHRAFDGATSEVRAMTGWISSQSTLRTACMGVRRQPTPARATLRRCGRATGSVRHHPFSAARTDSSFRCSAASSRGYSMPRFSSVSTITSETMSRALRLSSAGTIYQGALAVLVAPRQLSYASM